MALEVEVLPPEDGAYCAVNQMVFRKLGESSLMISLANATNAQLKPGGGVIIVLVVPWHEQLG